MLILGAAEAARRERAELLVWALEDFRRFAGLLEIIPKGGRRQRLVLNKVQREYCANRTPRDNVLKSRRVGFTTLEQARDIYHFLTVPGAKVVAVCQSLTNHGPTRLLSDNYRVMFESLERAGLGLKFRARNGSEWVLADRDARLTIEEAGASEAAASKKGRAGGISRLHLTETAFYEYADETLNAMLECVSAPEYGTEIVDESTPNGATGFFYRQCKASAASGYRLHFFPWHDTAEYAVPLDAGERIEPQNEREQQLVAAGVKPEQLKWYRRKVAEKGQALVDQEYPSDPETCFLVSGRGFFDQGVTSRLLGKAPMQPLERLDRDRVSIWKQPEKGRRYLLSADTAEGGGGDPSGALMYDRESGEHVATITGQYQPWELAGALDKLGRRYNTAEVVVERNNHGHAVLQALDREHKYPKIYKHEDGKPGWPTNMVTRPVVLDALEDSHRRELWKSPDRAVLAQLRTFIVTDTGKAEAARGEHDDLVLAAAIGWAARSKPQTFYGTVTW